MMYAVGLKGVARVFVDRLPLFTSGASCLMYPGGFVDPVAPRPYLRVAARTA
jgi:hypothetical protein